MKIDLKESLNELDIISDNRYDLYNTYLAKNPSNDLKKKIVEAIYNNRSPKEILMVINEKWDDASWHDTADQEQVDQPDYIPDIVDEWEVMDHKSVKDSDGFLTDYTWYKNSNTGEHVFVFGDSDLYGPEDGWYDWECDSDEEAEEWFDNYTGPGDDEDDWMDESLNESNDSKVFVVKTLQNYPYNGWIELMDKIDEKGEGEKHRFYDRKKLDDFAKELVKQGYKNYQGYSKNNKDMKNEALYDDIYHDFRVARENWKKLNLGTDFDSALDEWNKKSKLADPNNQSKPIYNKEAWNDMVSMFSNKNESLKEDFSDYDKALAQVDREAEEMINRYDKGDESIFDILSDLGYVSDDPNSVYMYKEVGNGNAIVFDLEPFDDGKGYIKYFVVDDSDKIPSGYTSTRLFIGESLKEDASKEWKPNLNFKHIKDVLEKALSRGKYINNEREEVKAALDLCDKKQKYTPEQRKFIQDSHREMWKKNRKTESLNEDMVRVEPTEKDLNKLVNVLTKYGFKVDNNYKPGRDLFGSYHVQVINPDLDYIDFDQLVKDVEPLGDALDNLSFDINLPITYNFGANDDNVITGGIDIHVGYKDDSDLGESLTEDLAYDIQKLHDESDYLWNLHGTDYTWLYTELSKYGNIDEEGIANLVRKMPKRKQHELYDKLVKPLHESLKESLSKNIISDIENKLYSIVKKYFHDDNYSHTQGIKITESNYDLLKYTARPYSGYRNTSSKLIMDDNGYSINEFKSEVRKYLKQFGITKVKFDTKKIKLHYGYVSGPDDYPVICLNAIYFNNVDSNVDESLNEASYGGAFDIEDDMYFTKEELVEFAGDIAEEFSKLTGHLNCDIDNVYIENNPLALNVDIYDPEDGVSHSAYTRIDMRKIRKPSDIYKYMDRILKQLEDSFHEYHENDFEDAD